MKSFLLSILVNSLLELGFLKLADVSSTTSGRLLLLLLRLLSGWDLGFTDGGGGGGGVFDEAEDDLTFLAAPATFWHTIKQYGDIIRNMIAMSEMNMRPRFIAGYFGWFFVVVDF